MKRSIGNYFSGQKDSSMTFPLFHSMVTHFVILFFILTLPLDSGSLTAHSLGSLLLYFGNDEEMEGRTNDRDFMKTDLSAPGQVIKEEVSIGEEGPGEKSDHGIDKQVSVIMETASASPRENTGVKVSHPTPTALTPVNEKRDEAFVAESPQSRNDQVKTIAVEDVRGIEGNKDETTKADAGAGSGRVSELSGVRPGEVVSSPGSLEVSARSATTAARNGPGTPEVAGKGTQPEIGPVLTRQGDTGRVEEHAEKMETAKSSVKAKKIGSSERMGFGLPKVAEPTLSDIKIEVAFEGGDAGFLSMGLFKKAYPVPAQKSRKKRQDNVSCAVERKVEDSAAGQRQIISVRKAEKGIYTFVIDNRGTEGRNAAIVFYLYEGRKEKRTKEYKAVRIQPASAARFKFIIPDVLFWDDEDRFSGEIEDSISITKFNSESGFAWREDKD